MQIRKIWVFKEDETETILMSPFHLKTKKGKNTLNEWVDS